MNRTRITSSIAMTALILIFLSGCNLWGDGGTTSLRINAAADNTARNMSRLIEQTPEVIFTKAEIGLERIELKLLGDETVTDTDTDTMFNGPYAIDLLVDLSEQEIGEVVINEGTYTKIEMELSPQLAGASTIIIEGTYDHDSATPGDAAPFVFTYTNSQDFKIENTSGIEISESGADVLVSFDLDTWITSDILSGATVSGGIITIDSGTNKDLFDAIEANIEAAGTLGLDENGDGIID